MSNASKMGRVDRRVKVPGTEVCCSDGFKRVYEGLIMKDSEKLLIETAAFRSASGGNASLKKRAMPKPSSRLPFPACPR